ncbi:low-specificity L-threonine aldolase [Iodobacter sp.]|uniref:low-specificity L-threonine aldolase n=1 Tax=Iodobacter sp. TaxID=1915058 RepID=UPI0025D739E9|nr:low-specificity L-threonine aldolase [Iodobacter sp.]
MQWIDLRSDTVTQPTNAMRTAMMNAVVGDDVYGDDETVNELERLAAGILGFEAALFLPTGTFGNQLALFTHCERGDEVILGEDSHIVWHEVGGAAVIAGVNLRPIPTVNGVLDASQVRRRIRPEGDIHLPRTRLICMENAHSSGRVIPLAAMQEIWETAQTSGLKVHLDGARVFNAATSLGVDVKQITQYADSVMCCLSKGLAAPVGSILAGDKTFIEIARKKRKLLGGGWRQAGVLAAPALLALTEMTQRLGEDHTNAQYLGKKLAELPNVRVCTDQLQINMVFFEITQPVDEAKILAHLSECGIKSNGTEAGQWRFVCHWQVGRAEIDRVIAAMKEALAAA